MNIKPFYQQVVACVGDTQDGGKISPKDHYGLFLMSLIKANTQSNPLTIDAGEVDTEELASNLRYAIHEFNKALKAVERFNIIQPA